MRHKDRAPWRRHEEVLPLSTEQNKSRRLVITLTLAETQRGPFLSEKEKEKLFLPNPMNHEAIFSGRQSELQSSCVNVSQQIDLKESNKQMIKLF